MHDKQLNNKTLDQLLIGLVENRQVPKIEAARFCADSRHLQRGDIFIAIDTGHHHIDTAIKKGAQVVIVDRALPFKLPVPVIRIACLSEKLPTLLQRYFDYQDSDMNKIAITGTNGKTTCSQLIAQMLTASQQTCGVIGTLGHGLYPALGDANLTTPDLFSVYELLAKFKQQGAKTVCIEASSHGLVQNRLAGLDFEVGIFTNLTHDHLDYHRSLADYSAAKGRLFARSLGVAIINMDDAFGRQLIAKHRNDYPIYAYTLQSPQKTSQVQCIQATDVQINPQCIVAKIVTPWGRGDLSLPLIGQFNLYNALAAITCLAHLGHPIDEILHAISQVKEVAGRMQCLTQANSHIIIDFAHTPDALKQVLCALRAHCQGQLICVFGCGGDRDRDKRSQMGQLAEQLADKIIITNDNPRYESEQSIINDIMLGIHNKSRVIVQPDRALAIREALAVASGDDWVLIAGKGHEQYQQIKSERHYFSDAQVVRDILEEERI